MRRLLTGCYAALLVLLVAAPAASQPAPPQYQSSEPSDGATVHRPPDRVEATFDQPLDESSALMITDECDRRVDDGATEVSGNSMSVALEEKPAGHYRVDYFARGLAGVTGQQRGFFEFTAHGGPSCGEGAGGHGDHGGHGGDGTGHGEGHRGDGTGHGDHGGGDHGTGDHAGGDHSSGTEHAGMDHSSTDGSGHTDHAADSGSGAHGNGDHSGHGDRSVAAGDDSFNGITSSDTERNLLTRADSTALMISLLLCVALGILGGVVLRATNSS